MTEPEETAYWDWWTLREKLIELGLDSTEDIPFGFDESEYMSLLWDCDTQRDFDRFEYFMYLAQFDGLELEIDEHLRHAFRTYDERPDYEFLWGSFHVEEQDMPDNE